MYARRVYMHLKPNSVAEFTGEDREGRHSHPSKTEGIPRRNHVRCSVRNGSVRDQFVGSSGKRGGL